MVRFLSHHELENLYYMYGKYEEAYQTLLERKQEHVTEEETQKQLNQQIEIVKQQQRQMLAALT